MEKDKEKEMSDKIKINPEELLKDFSSSLNLDQLSQLQTLFALWLKITKNNHLSTAVSGLENALGIVNESKEKSMSPEELTPRENLLRSILKQASPVALLKLLGCLKNGLTRVRTAL